MARESELKAGNSLDDSVAQSPEEIRVRLEVRLHLEEVAELEAFRLKSAPRREPTRRELCQLACRMYDARRTRDKLLDQRLFGEPAWDMLLALYCLPARGEFLGQTALTHAAGLTPTTGHRWQHVLIEEGLIERGPQGVETRKQFNRLTEKGRAMMDAYLTRLFYVDTPVPPYPESAGG